MKYPTLSYITSAAGLFVLTISWTQWFFRFPDVSQLFLGTLISLNIIAGAYIYAWMKRHDKLADDWENRFQGVMKIIFKEEFK